MVKNEPTATMGATFSLAPLDKGNLRATMRRTADITADLLTRPDRSTKRRRQFAKMGYKLLRITVTDADTGEVVTHRETYRKQEDLTQFQRDTIKLAMWPDELLSQVSWGFFDSRTPEMEKVTTAKRVQKRSALGGRKKQGSPSRKTQDRYLELADTFNKAYKLGISQADFCRQTNTKPSTLKRALTYYDTSQKNRAKKW